MMTESSWTMVNMCLTSLNLELCRKFTTRNVWEDISREMSVRKEVLLYEQGNSVSQNSRLYEMEEEENKNDRSCHKKMRKRATEETLSSSFTFTHVHCIYEFLHTCTIYIHTNYYCPENG